MYESKKLRRMETAYRIPFFNVSMFREVLQNSIDRASKTYNVKVVSYVIMPDHVHLMLDGDHEMVDRFIKSVRKESGSEIARILGDRGKVWGDEVWMNHTLSAGQEKLIREKIENNPVRNELVKRAEDYKYSSASN
jgi:REP element-mobilizing transposase RayT